VIGSTASSALAQRAAATRPGGALRSLGDVGRLTAHTLRLALTPPFPWWRDAVVEFATAFRRCCGPIVLSMIVFAAGIAVLFVGQIIDTLGTPDRLNGALTIGFMREPAVWVTSMVFAGVAGSAMTADIGARRIRDELDALTVLGMDLTRALVVPRVVALVFVAPVLGLLTLSVAYAVDYVLVPLFYPSVTYAGQAEIMDKYLYSVDLVFLLIKLPLVGLFVGIVACYKGLTTKGGAEGVGRSVNQAVVTMFLGLWLMNGIVNTGYLALFPSVQELRG